eukprot:TRINITY_DN8843_c0_g1_i1.p1 TRINITY_DN8843_c0_g1~~TRINITY_DN8843_c0_g1_i1.p1  ORF type:complete len:943 (+),score=195.79 TRINITY_DN8843_c0_g1_i1:61-2889(+)
MSISSSLDASERVIRIYFAASGTEIDQERSHFVQYGIPQLLETATELNLELILLDLSWGFQDDNAFAQIQSRLSALSKCCYVVGLLGNRYGEIVQANCEEGFSEQNVHSGKSLLDIEMTAACSSHLQGTWKLFLFKQHAEYFATRLTSQEDVMQYKLIYESEASKLEELMRRVEGVEKIQDFISPEDLCSQLVSQIKESMKADFVPMQQNVEPEERAHLQFMRHRLACFEGREELISGIVNEIKTQLDQDSSTALAIAAESGIGKSSIMAALVSRLDQLFPTECILYHFVGCTNMSSYVPDLSARLWKNTIKYLNDDEGILKEESNLQSLSSLVDYITSHNPTNKKFIFVIDAVNQLESSQNVPCPWTLSWLPKKLPRNVALVYSTIDQHQCFDATMKAEAQIVKVSRLSTDEVTEAIQKYLTQYGHSLSRDRLEFIIRESPCIGHALYLRVFLDHLRSTSNRANLDLEIHRLLSCEDVVELYKYVINTWELRFGHKLVKETLIVLKISRIGFTERNLDQYIESILGSDFNVTRWKAFLYTMMDSLFIQNGRYSFFHQIFLETIEAVYLGTRESKIDAYSSYATWMLQQPERQSLAESEAAEITHALVSAERFEETAAYLSKHDVVKSFLDGRYRYEFFHYWRALRKINIFDTTYYAELVKDKGKVGRLLIDYFRETQQHSFLIPVIQERIKEFHDSDEKHYDVFTLGWVLYDIGKIDDALRNHELALEIRIRLAGKEDPLVADSHNHVGLCHWVARRYEEAKEAYTKSLELRQSLYGLDHIDVAQSNNNFGALYHSMGIFDKALEYYLTSCRIYRRLRGETHPDIATAYNNLGVIYDAMDRTSDALDYYCRSLRILTEILGENHLNVAQLCMNVAIVYKRLHMLKEAAESAERSYKIRESILGPSDKKTLEAKRAHLQYQRHLQRSQNPNQSMLDPLSMNE